MTDQELNRISAEVMGFPVLHTYQDVGEFSIAPTTGHVADILGTVRIRDKHFNTWTPTTDANQALELAEHVWRKVGGYYDSFSPYSIENSTDEEGLKFKFTWYAHNIADERIVSASDKVFARALTITSLLANESLGSKS